MRVLIAEDDPALASFVRKGLEAEHYAVDVTLDGEQARAMAGELEYDLLMLDLNLPRVDGVTILRHLRTRKPSLPILVLTSRNRVEDRVQCLDLGADDYMGKPFSFAELSARIRALLRRSHLPAAATLAVADLKLDRVERRVERAGKRIDLTSKEFGLLEYLMLNAGRRVTRAMIIEHVWNLSFDTGTNVGRKAATESTDMSTEENTDTVAREFMELWARSAANVMGQITSGAFPINVTDEGPTELAAAGPADVYLTITAAGAARGEMSLRQPAGVALQIAKTFSGDAGERAEPTSEDREALDELFRQIAGHVSTGAKQSWKDLAITVASGQAPTWSSGASGWHCSAADAPFMVAIEWRLSSALATSLQLGRQDAAGQPSRSAATNDAAGPKYDLLMNVELELTLRFGERDMFLRDILELGAGSVVQLDREIQDPADLLLDGRLIARGEVVVVDGNFGLRVTEVIPGSAAAA